MSNTYWLNGKYISKEEAYLSPLTHTLHYGLGAFEGEGPMGLLMIRM